MEQAIESCLVLVTTKKRAAGFQILVRSFQKSCFRQDMWKQL